ncbi:MAG: S8 family serine peptidase [Pseudomonadota bacterium]
MLFRLLCAHVFSVAGPVALAFCAISPFVHAETAALRPDEKPVISRKDDLPRHTYQLDVPVTDLYAPENREVLLALANEVQADILSNLEAYNITDDSTVQDFYSVLGVIALLENRWQDYLDLLEQQRSLESKEATRLTMGMYGEALAKAQLSDNDPSADLRANLESSLESLNYDLVQDNIKSAKGRTEILSEALVMGSLDSSYQPIVDRNNGQISYDIASALVGTSFTLDHFLRDAPLINEVYTAYITEHDVAKPDIWEARQYNLSENTDATPVTVAIWDSGVDTSIGTFQPLLWRNPHETADSNQDNDNNTYVDDVHGIAYDLDANRESSLLYPVGEFDEDIQVMQRRVKGLGDIQSNVDSEEAAELRRKLSSLEQDQVAGFLESLNIYGNYAHGTHVAGIAIEGNPFIRILVARMTYGHTLIPEEPTLEKAEAQAAMFRDVIDYFKTYGVRAVNMSWGGSLRGIEEALEANNAGGTVERRKALARQIYTIVDSALRKAIQGAGDILFITSAGNSDNDVTFDEFYPSSYDFPNIISVGAVDAAGDETSFTSLGKVDIYANGFEVESYVPGGDRIKFNGTSMSSPQVLNLAAKLLALNPQLTTEELRQLILDGSDAKELSSRTIQLLNPAASVALLKTDTEAES